MTRTESDPTISSTSTKRHPDDLRLVQVMVRPRWIIALLLALAVAGGFSWLGRWQLDRAIASGRIGPVVTETSEPLQSVLKPGVAIRTERVGQLVTTAASFVPGDYSLLTGRLNQHETGYWVVGHARVITGGSGKYTPPQAELAVGRGFTTSKQTALAEVATLNAEPVQTIELSGRLLPSEAPEQSEDDMQGTPPQMKDMSVALLINEWHSVPASAPLIYEAYLVEKGSTIPAGLDPIFSPAPSQQRAIDWLNAFYAVEWVVFAGFAIYLWYRLTRDVWEREIEKVD